jgi:hypothetical protein
VSAPGDRIVAPGGESATLGAPTPGMLAVGQSAELFEGHGHDRAVRARAATLSTVAQWLVFWLAFAVADVQ